MAAKPAVSPVRQQYLDIKRQHPEAILFFRLGDFYETFDEDAELVARELDIVLTSRNVAKGTRVPMAGVPHHAAENYLARLIERGHHVAICEQVGDEPIKGLMPREVVRIVDALQRAELAVMFDPAWDGASECLNLIEEAAPALRAAVTVFSAAFRRAW